MWKEGDDQHATIEEDSETETGWNSDARDIMGVMGRNNG